MSDRSRRRRGRLGDALPAHAPATSHRSVPRVDGFVRALYGPKSGRASGPGSFSPRSTRRSFTKKGVARAELRRNPGGRRQRGRSEAELEEAGPNLPGLRTVGLSKGEPDVGQQPGGQARRLVRSDSNVLPGGITSVPPIDRDVPRVRGRAAQGRLSSREKSRHRDPAGCPPSKRRLWRTAPTSAAPRAAGVSDRLPFRTALIAKRSAEVGILCHARHDRPCPPLFPRPSRPTCCWSSCRCAVVRPLRFAPGRCRRVVPRAPARRLSPSRVGAHFMRDRSRHRTVIVELELPNRYGAAAARRLRPM